MKNYLMIGANSLLIILWVYAAGSKLAEFHAFRYQLSIQHFPIKIDGVLVYVLPFIELLSAFLLTKKSTQNSGLVISFSLLLVFTIYISLILLGIFTKVPCSCGGVLSILTWKTHIIFNLTFLSLNGWLLYEFTKEERRSKKSNSKLTMS